jgi:hypothetical protein
VDNRNSERGSEAGRECPSTSSGAYEWLLEQFADIDRKFRFHCAAPQSEVPTEGGGATNPESR